MHRKAFEDLVSDAQLLADISVRLGKLKRKAFLPALSAAQEELAKNQEPIDSKIITNLQFELNAAIPDIAPITLLDLHLGWSPIEKQAEKKGEKIAFVFFCILLMIFVASTTQLYNKAAGLYNSLISLQGERPPEQVLKLYELALKNKKNLPICTGDECDELLSDFLYKSIFDLQALDEKVATYFELGSGVSEKLKGFEDALSPIDEYVFPLIQKLEASEKVKAAVQYSSSPGYQAAAGQDLVKKALEPQTENSTLSQEYDKHLTQASMFASAIGAPHVNSKVTPPTSRLLYELHNGISSLGFWILPALYGMLGAVVFHMRRFLDPYIPTPDRLRTVYRVALSGFAGIIVGWFLNPVPRGATEIINISLSPFGFAFLVGFSIDLFFQSLDKFVTNASRVIGRAST